MVILVHARKGSLGSKDFSLVVIRITCPSDTTRDMAKSGAHVVDSSQTPDPSMMAFPTRAIRHGTFTTSVHARYYAAWPEMPACLDSACIRSLVILWEAFYRTQKGL